MQSLVLHDHCKPGPIRSVSATITATAKGCRARFLLQGDISAIIVPEYRVAARTDFLWRSTSFEVFWQPDGGTFYREFNLSPSGCWACYDFDDFRLNSRDGPTDAIAVSCASTGEELILDADICSELARPAQIALNAIVEDKAGNIQYWALAFAAGKPDFHHVATRTLRMGKV